MNPEEFKRLTSLHQMELLLDEGVEVITRIYIFYNIRLFALFDFFVEVWYHQTTNKIDKIVILKTDDVMDIYEKYINLNDLLK